MIDDRRGGFRPREPSTLVGCLPGDAPPPGASELAERLEAAGLEVDAPADGAQDELSARAPARGDRPERVYRLWLHPHPPGDDHLRHARLTQPQEVAMRASRLGLVVTTTFEGSPLEAYHAQLRVLAAAAPDLAGVLDVDAFAVRPGVWLREAASTDVPPVPTSLFTVHAVAGDREVWFHTHGLRRCGTVELEAFRVRLEDRPHLGELLNAVAAMAIEKGLPDAGVPFAAGQDIVLGWLPWRAALEALGGAECGGVADRDDVHGAASAALVVPRRRLLVLPGWTDVGALAPRLAADPLLYHSAMETARATLLARERLPEFRALHARLGARDDHRFLVKLGFPVDGATDGSREHIWFAVHGFSGDAVDATCSNVPFAVSSLSEGQRGLFPLQLLSDLLVLTPSGQYGPDLLRLLGAPPPRAELLS